jgi:RNase H-fold protein (predicted Holliday junction resolvase)
MSRILQFALGLLLVVAVGTAIADDKAKTMTASGKVTAVAGDSLTIMKGTESMTFMVDATTKIVGTGLSHKSAEAKTEGKALTLADAVGKDDQVIVKYHDMEGKMHAAEVKVTQKALKATK